MTTDSEPMAKHDTRVVRVSISRTYIDELIRFELTVENVGKRSYAADARRLVGTHGSTGIGQDVPFIRPGGKDTIFRSADAAYIAAFHAALWFAETSEDNDH